MKDLRLSFSRIVKLLSVSVVGASLWGCGGGASTTTAPTPVTTTPTSSNATLQGQWQIVAHSNVNPASSILVEANFSQNGTTVTADTSSVVLIEGSPGALTGLAGECDNGVLGHDSASATISGQTLSFTLTEAGSLGTGTSTGTAMISSDGTQITSGTYQTVAACGFTADNGSLTGTPIRPFSGTFTGQLENSSGSTDAVVIALAQSGYTLNAVGTDAGTPITLNGKVVGATFDVTGIVQGQSREYVGIFDTASNNLRVYDNAFEFLGSLTPQSSPPPPPLPINVAVSPSVASVAVSSTQIFTPTVSNDPAHSGVMWTISGGGCAGASCGLISGATSASGASVTYTAPAALPSPPTVTLTATSLADPTKSASATITLTSNSGSVTGVAVTCSPSTIASTATSACSALVSGSNSPSQSVTWRASPGTISSAGVLTPPSVTAQTQITVTATSATDASKSGTFEVTVNPPASQPRIIASGFRSSADVTGNSMTVAFQDPNGSHTITSTDDGQTWSVPTNDQGNFEDLKNGVILTSVSLGNSATTTLFTNGLEIGTENGFNPVLIGPNSAAWISGGVCVTGVIACLHSAPNTDFGDLTSTIAPDGTAYLAWDDEPSNQSCQVWFANASKFIGQGNNAQVGVQVDTSSQCANGISIFLTSSGTMLVTWSGGEVARSTDGGNTFSPATPVFQTPSATSSGAAFAQKSDGSLIAVFDQFIVAEESTSVWSSTSSDDGATWTAPVRVSAVLTHGAFGASNPVVTSDGSIAWLQDSNGGTPSKYDVYLNGVSITQGSDVSGLELLVLPDGTRALCWQDNDNSVWFQAFPK